MAVTETTRQSWISRLGDSLKGIIVGLVLFIIGFPVLFWNEGNSVRTAKALDEGEGACISLDTAEAIDSDYDGRLIHASARAETTETLRDAEFGIFATAIRLEREVEMYQWEEESHTTEKKNLGGSVTRTTTYTYDKVWSDRAIVSSDFKEAGHDNPRVFPYTELSRQAEVVRFGAFRLTENQIQRIGGEREFELPPDYICPLAAAQRVGNTLYLPPPVASQAVSAAADDGQASLSAPATNSTPVTRNIAAEPQVGDMRVSFKVIYPHDVSIVAKQRGDTFSAFVAKNGKKVDMVADGIRDAAEMFAAARRGNAITTWIIRLVGFLLMLVGLSSILKPLSVVGDVVPFVGTIIGIGTGLVAAAGALICALTTIAIAWIFYRPVIGIALLAIAALIAWKVWQRRKANA